MLILAHRGAHHEAGENTLEAFRAAAATGADGVELDVRLSADGCLVIHHDARLPDGRVVAETAGVPLPSLGDALAACHGLAVVDVEIKSSPLEPGYDPGHAVSALVAAAVSGHPGVLVSSFDLAALDAVRAANPAIRTGWLTFDGYDQAEAVATAAAGRHGVLAPPDGAVTPDLVRLAHDAGLEVVAWTVNDGDRMAALAAMGVDALVTDRPALAASVVGRNR